MNSSIQRSNRPEVRNPVLALPAFKAVLDLDEPSKRALASVLDNLSKDAESRAQNAWLKKKGPMSVYWKCLAVYSKHISRAIRKAGQTSTISRTILPEAVNENQDDSARAA